MTRDTDHTREKPWYRQFWPWLLVLIPVAGMTMSLITVTTAFRHADEVIERNDAPALGKDSWRQQP